MAKRRRTLPPPLTEAQLEIMQFVWERGEVGVADVWNALRERRDVSRNTIQTQMSRLHERGWLRQRAEGNAFFYRAAHSRDEARQQLVRDLVRSAFGGAADGLVMTLLQTGVSPEEATRIRQLIERAERGEGT